MSALETEIDRLYALPLGEFVAARNTLARTLPRADAARVRHLQKPTLVPWAVNQLYWHDRHAWARLLKAGQALRTAQVATLEGRPADLRKAAATHREALAHALTRIAALTAPGVPSADQLGRMLEAVSLAPEPPEPAGRFTELVQPAGFEALSGIVPVAASPPPGPPPVSPRRASAGSARKSDPQAAARAAAEAAAAARAEAQRRAEDTCRRAEAAVAAATSADDQARADADVAARQFAAAQERRERTGRLLDEARRALDEARAALAALGSPGSGT